ncbi:uncharacterized protein LOC123322226 [Coccinella septempunctata]|uniref:uncharacterized protein LOC123322226 n=1 Tax=Coccinella septempunctata TaxID=41139 RepID=UPI001D0777AC|nr:uncharacterized protein LOC123322226 [Coccinella septempunctata]XP_044766071.1 uncharacterized protein LOC123322226 [Coccinella septempunctata]
MMVDVLVQIQATQRANKEEKERKNRRMFLAELLRSHPVMTSDHDSYKLRTSKWFDHEEISIVCSVLETGFIVEKKHKMQDDSYTTYGIALWDLGYEKSKNPNHLNICGLIDDRVYIFKLLEFWTMRTQIKISNSGDRFYPYNDEEAIISQLKRAQKMKFNSDEQFVCFCRYGKPRKPSDTSWSLSNIVARFRAFSARW